MMTNREILEKDPFGKGIMEAMFRDHNGEKPTLEVKGAPYWFLATWREGRIKSESRLAAVPGLDGNPVIWHDKDTAKREFASRYGNQPYLLMQAHEGRSSCFVEQIGSKSARPATLVGVPAVVESVIREIRTHTDGERKHTHGEWPKISAVTRAKKGKKAKKNIWFIDGERKGTVAYWNRSANGNATSDYMDGKKKWWGANLEDIEIINESSSIHWKDIDKNASVIREDREDGVAYFADGLPVFWYNHENLATTHLDKIANVKNTQVTTEQDDRSTSPVEMNMVESILNNIRDDEFQEMAENAALKAKLVTIYRDCYRGSSLQEARQKISFDPSRRQYSMTIQRENLIKEAEVALNALTGASVERSETDGSITFSITISEAKKAENTDDTLLKDVVHLFNHKPRFKNGDVDSYTVAAKIDKCLEGKAKCTRELLKDIQGLLNRAPRFTAGDVDSYKVAARVDKRLAQNMNEGKVTEPMKNLKESVADLAQRKTLKDIVRSAITSVGTCPVSKKELKESNTVVIDIPNEGQTVVHAEVWDRGKSKIMSEHPNATIYDSRVLAEGREFDPFTSKNPKSKFDPFVAGYIAAALFTIGEDEAKKLGVSIQDVTVDHLSPEAIKDLTKVAKNFWKKYKDTIEEAGLDPFRAGNLLYYAHSGAGVTWLDDDDNEALQKLSKAPEAGYYAYPYGLYVGDDGKLYRENINEESDNLIGKTVKVLKQNTMGFRMERHQSQRVYLYPGKYRVESSIKHNGQDSYILRHTGDHEPYIVAKSEMDTTILESESQKNDLAALLDSAGLKPVRNQKPMNEEKKLIKSLLEQGHNRCAITNEVLTPETTVVMTIPNKGRFVMHAEAFDKKRSSLKENAQIVDGRQVFSESEIKSFEAKDEDIEENTIEASIAGSSDLGKKLHQWHTSESDAIFKVGSKFVAGKKVTKKECLAAAKILKETEDAEAQALGLKLREMCGATNPTNEGLAKLAHAIAETTAAWNDYQAIESRRKVLGEKVTHTARQMGGGVRTYGLTIKAKNDSIVAESCSNTGNQLYPFVPFDENNHTNNANEFAKFSSAADKAAETYDKLYKRTEDIAESLGLEAGTHDTPLGVIEITPEGNMRLTYVKSESFAVNEDNPVRSWMLTKPFREYAEGMLNIIGQQFEKASAKAHEAVKKAGGRIDFGGFAIANENNGVVLYGQGKGARPFLENVANGTISVPDPIREWAQTVLLRQTFKITAENLKAIEDRSRNMVLDKLPENAVASIAFDGRECGTLYKRGEHSVFVDAHSTDRVFGSKAMTETEANAVLAWSRLHDIDSPESLEEQAVYQEQLSMYNELISKIGESQEYFCFLNDEGVMIEVLKDGEEICGARAEAVTHKITNTGMEVTETKVPAKQEENKAFKESEEVPVDLSAAQLTLELRSAIKDMNSGLVEKAAAAAVNVGNIANATIKAWTEKLGGTYQESGDADIFEGATSITDTITRSWVLLDQAKNNHKVNEAIFDTPYGKKLGTMLDEATMAFAATVESFYTPQPCSAEDKLDEQLVAEASMDLHTTLGNFAELVESTSILEPSALKMQALSIARTMDKMDKAAGPKTPMKTETQKYALSTAHGIVSMAHALIRSLGKDSGEAKQALIRMEKDPLFKEWSAQINKKKNPQGSISIASEEVKAIRSGLNAASRQLARISGEGVKEMQEAILAARKVVNKIGVDVSLKNLSNPGEDETHFEAKSPEKPKVSVETLPEDQQATVKEYLRLQAKIKSLKDEMEALEAEQSPSKEAVVNILETIEGNLEDAEGAVISLRSQPGKILYNQVIEQALKRVNEATRKIIETLMESTRGKDSKYPVVTQKNSKDMQTEGMLSNLASMGKKAVDALVKVLRGYNSDLKDAVEQLQVAAKNARIGIVSEVASRNPKDDASGESDLSPNSGLADKDGRRDMGASRENPGTTKSKALAATSGLNEDWPSDADTGKPDLKPDPIGTQKNKRIDRPDKEKDYKVQTNPKALSEGAGNVDPITGTKRSKYWKPWPKGKAGDDSANEGAVKEDSSYSGELRTNPKPGLANQTGNDEHADSAFEPEGSVKRDNKRPEISSTK